MADEQRAWKVDLNKLSGEAGQAVQHAQQLLSALVHAADLARRAHEGIRATLAEIEDTRNRGSVKMSRATTLEAMSSVEGLDGRVVDQAILRRQARSLLDVFGGISTVTGLQKWYLDQVRRDRQRPGSSSIHSQPSVAVTGALFAPLNGDGPHDNGQALTLRVQTAEPGTTPMYMNLGNLIALALIGARVATLTAPNEDEDDDEDDDWNSRDYPD